MLTPIQELELRKYGKEKGYSQEKINSFIQTKKKETITSVFEAPLPRAFPAIFNPAFATLPPNNSAPDFKASPPICFSPAVPVF